MHFDWLQLWSELVSASLRNPGGDLVNRYKKHALQKTERPDSLLEFVLNSLDSQSCVLDIGAGSGRWTVPLARKVLRVTAVEPSAGMLEILRQNIQSAGLTNVDIAGSTWEEAAVDEFDVSVCAHAMYSSPDLGLFVRKMEEHTRRACYLAVRLPAADGILGDICEAVYGRRHDSANAIIAYNALYELGIYCNVLVENTIYPWSDSSLEEAFLRVKRHLHLEVRDSYDGLIRETLARKLQFRDGRYYWPDGMRSALLWWNVGRRGY